MNYFISVLKNYANFKGRAIPNKINNTNEVFFTTHRARVALIA